MAKNKPKTDDELDLAGWREAEDTARNLFSGFGAIREQMQDSEDAYFLNWKNRPTSQQVKATISPAPRVKVQGAVRLLTATAPTWELPKEKNNPDAEQVSSKIEKFANKMWLQSNNIQQLRVEEDITLSAFLYDEIQVRVISTLDLLESVRTASVNAEQEDGYDETRWQNEIAFAQAVADRTPYLYETVSPMTGRYIKSRLGLEAHYTETDLLVADILAQYGQRAQDALMGAKPYHTRTVYEWWDKTYHYVGVKGGTPFVGGKHGLPMIPIVVVRVEGSGLFSKPERQNEPFLYTVLKSGLIERQNEMLTVLFTNMAALMDAQFVHKKGNDQAGSIDVSHNVIGGVVEVEPGGEFGPMVKNIFDPSVEKGLRLVDDLFDGSTIYSQALGERVSGSDNFSLVSLLSQAGRLPLVPTQEAMKSAFAALMEISFKWLKKDGKKVKYDYGELSAQEIPDRLEFTANVEVDMPQDKLQQVTIATQATAGPDPLVSKGWARTKVLNEGQSDELQKEIWDEQAAAFAFQSGMRPFVQAMIQKMASMKPPGQPPSASDQAPVTPPPTPPTTGPMGEGGMTPESMPPDSASTAPLGAMNGGANAANQ